MLYQYGMSVGSRWSEVLGVGSWEAGIMGVQGSWEAADMMLMPQDFWLGML